MIKPINDFTMTWTARQNLIRNWDKWSILQGVPIQAAYDLGLGLSRNGTMLRITAGSDRACRITRLKLGVANALIRSWVRNQRHQFEQWVSRAGKDASFLRRMIEKSSMTGGRHD